MKISAQRAELADAQLRVIVGELLHLRHRFPGEADHGQPFHPARTRRLGEQDRITAAAGDDAQRVEVHGFCPSVTRPRNCRRQNQSMPSRSIVARTARLPPDTLLTPAWRAR